MDRSVKQNRESRNKLTNSTDYILTKVKKKFNGGKFPFQQMVWEKLNIHSGENTLELNLTSYTKSNIKWITDLM